MAHIHKTVTLTRWQFQPPRQHRIFAPINRPTGLFEVFKRSDKTSDNNPSVKPPIEPNGQGEFNLKLTDFNEEINRSEVLEDPWINTIPDPEFEKAIALLLVGPPMKKGDVIELKSYVIRVILWGQTVELKFDPG